MKGSVYIPKSPEEKVEGISILLPLQSRAGFIFLLAKTRKMTSDAEELLQLLSEHVHRLAESFGSEANAQQRFEHFLGALNETLAQNVRDGRIRVFINQFDAVVGIACDNRMFLSGTGDICALFLHLRSQQRYQIFNLSRSIQTEQSLPTWEKAFAVVLDGDLHEGDVFALSNQDLQRAIPTEDLNSVLTTLPPKGSVEKLRQYFPERSAVLLIILKLEQISDAVSVSESKAQLKTDVSINRFKQQEDTTQRLLEDQTPKISTLVRILNNLTKRLKESNGWKKFWRWSRRMAWNALKNAVHLKTKEGRVEAKGHAFALARSVHKRAIVLFYQMRHIERSTKYLATGIVTVAIILIISVSFLSRSRARSEEQRSYDFSIEKIDDLLERAEGAMIYKDENQARGLYINASTLIDQLPTNSAERQTKQWELKDAVQKATDEIRHIITVPNPALLGDLAVLTDGVFGQAFIKSGSEVYVFASDGRVYQLDRTQKVFKPVSSQINDPSIAIAASEEDGRIYALMSDQSIREFILNESVQKLITFEKPEGMVDLMAYANRVYVLTTTQNDGQIYRFGQTGDGFGTGSSWIASKTTSLSQARSLAIDGSVYVLEKDGRILRFDNGAEIGFTTGIVDPPITNAIDLWTDNNSSYLYVLEPDTKRVVVFDKQSGAFIVQFRSDSFQNANDLIVDESAYSIYVLAGSKIYSIAPSHITR